MHLWVVNFLWSIQGLRKVQCCSGLSWIVCVDIYPTTLYSPEKLLSETTRDILAIRQRSGATGAAFTQLLCYKELRCGSVYSEFRRIWSCLSTILLRLSPMTWESTESEGSGWRLTHSSMHGHTEWVELYPRPLVHLKCNSCGEQHGWLAKQRISFFSRREWRRKTHLRRMCQR